MGSRRRASSKLVGSLDPPTAAPQPPCPLQALAAIPAGAGEPTSSALRRWALPVSRPNLGQLPPCSALPRRACKLCSSHADA